MAFSKMNTPPKKLNLRPSIDGECNGRRPGVDDKGESGEDDPLLKRLHTIVEHQEELLQKQQTSDDWQAVATIFDRWEA